MKLVFVIFTVILVTSCENKSIIYFYSLDKTQCITVISEYDYRYVINGKYSQVPDTNYVKLHIKDRNSIWDNFYICWKNTKYEWDIVVKNSTILESRLDSSRFNFNIKLPKDEHGIPTDIKYSKEKCATYSFYLKKLIPNHGAIIEYE